MACGSIITYHWQLNTFITTCDFSRVCLLLCSFQRVAGLPTKSTFGFIRGYVFWDAVTALTAGTWRLDKDISSLLMWLEYNLLQESTATMPRPLYILIESNHLWTIWVTLENRPDPTSSGFSIIFATILQKRCFCATERWCHAFELSWASSWSHNQRALFPPVLLQ
jgi:hypothetical protein